MIILYSAVCGFSENISRCVNIQIILSIGDFLECCASEFGHISIRIKGSRAAVNTAVDMAVGEHGGEGILGGGFYTS